MVGKTSVDDAPITAAQVQLMQRGAEILSSRPALACDGEATRTRGACVGLAGGSRLQRMEQREEGERERRVWSTRNTVVMTASSLVLCLLVGSLLLMDVGEQALAPGVVGFMSGGAERESALLSGAVQKKTAAAQRLAQKAATTSQLEQKPELKVVEATPLQSLAKASAVATAKIVVAKPAVKFVKAPQTATAHASKPAAAATQKAVSKKATAAAKSAAPAASVVKPLLVASAAHKPPVQTQYMQQPAGAQLHATPPHAQAQAPYGQQQLYAQAPYGQQQAQAPFGQPQYYAPQQALAQPEQQQYTYQLGQQTGYAPSQYPQYAQAPYEQPQYYAPQQALAQPGQQTGYAPWQYSQYAQAPVQQPQLAYEQQQMPQPQMKAQQVQQPQLKQQMPEQAQRLVQVSAPLAPAALQPAQPKQVLAKAPQQQPAMPQVLTVKQLQHQVQTQSLGQQLVASLPPAVQQQQQAAQLAAGGPSPMMVDGSAADTASLQAQAGQQASKQLLKGIGSDSPQQLSLRQQMEQKMIAKFNRAVEPPPPYGGFGGYPQTYAQMPQAPQEPNQQLLAQAFGGSGNTMQQVKAQANPHIARMMAMGA